MPASLSLPSLCMKIFKWNFLYNARGISYIFDDDDDFWHFFYWLYQGMNVGDNFSMNATLARSRVHTVPSLSPRYLWSLRIAWRWCWHWVFRAIQFNRVGYICLFPQTGRDLPESAASLTPLRVTDFNRMWCLICQTASSPNGKVTCRVSEHY